MDDIRDDASNSSSSPFNSMKLDSPGSIDSHDINRQESRQQAISPRTELIVAERLEFELRQYRAEHASENRRLYDHFEAERDRADRLVDEFYQAELRRIEEEQRIEAEGRRRIEEVRIETERHRLEEEHRERDRIVKERVMIELCRIEAKRSSGIM